MKRPWKRLSRPRRHPRRPSSTSSLTARWRKWRLLSRNGKASGGWYEEEEEDTFAGASAPSQPAPIEHKKNRYSPSVRRLAEEHQLDLEKLGLRGSGINGRITRDDVLMYIEQQRKLRQPVPTRALPGQNGAAVPPPPPVKPMHEQIAANALRETPAAPAAFAAPVQSAPTPATPAPTPAVLRPAAMQSTPSATAPAQAAPAQDKPAAPFRYSARLLARRR